MWTAGYGVDPNWREFKHPLFKKGHLELLPLIKRKNGSSKSKSEKRERSRRTKELSPRSVRFVGPLHFDEREEEQDGPRPDSPRLDDLEEADGGDGVEIHERASGEQTSLADAHEKQKAARCDETADGACVPFSVQGLSRKPSSRHGRRFHAIRVSCDGD